MNIGIVGPEAAKFTPVTEAAARRLIRLLLAVPTDTCVSGECHLGGVDIFAKEEARALGRPYIGFPPRKLNWNNGYKPRNIQIAKTSNIVNVIVLQQLPNYYCGLSFPHCYHCHRDHVKSGGCWTGLCARRFNNRAQWHMILPDGTVEALDI